jgi:hypothetical protein
MMLLCAQRDRLTLGGDNQYSSETNDCGIKAESLAVAEGFTDSYRGTHTNAFCPCLGIVAGPPMHRVPKKWKRAQHAE